jgi:hypothetical protein
MFGRIGGDRRGLSNLMASILLVLFSLVAVGMLGLYINKVVGEAEFSPAFSCLDMKLDPTITLERACYNKETGDLELRVRRLGDSLYLSNLYFILNSGGSGESQTLCCGEGCESCDVLGSGESRNYYFAGSGVKESEKVVLSVLDCSIDEMELVAC